MSLLSQLLASVRHEYCRDATKAGVVISDLDGSEVYASICRYPTGPLDKRVVCSAKAKGLDAAIRALAVAWTLETKRLETFRVALGRSVKEFDRQLEKCL